MTKLILTLALVPSAAMAVPTLSATGDCPGRIAIDAGSLTPGGNIVVMAAGADGSTPIPVGPCAHSSRCSWGRWLRRISGCH